MTPRFPRGPLRAALLATGLVALAGAWLLYGRASYWQLRVAWSPGVQSVTREYSVRQLSMRLIRSDDELVWVCMLVDDSAGNLRAILSNSLIRDVGGLERVSMQLTERVTVAPVRWLLIRYPVLEQAGFGRMVRPLGLVPLFLAFLAIGLTASRDGRAWLSSRVPAVSPVSLGVFRIAFAAAWMLVAAKLVPLDLPGLPYARGLALALLVLFAIGAATRISFVAFVVVFTLSQVDKIGGHDIGLPLMTLWLLTLVPWGTGVSVDGRIRRAIGHRTSDAPERRYALAMLIPALTLGTAYASAAFAKIDESGPMWVTSGGVRYFLVIDAGNAPSGFGRFIASSDVLSVAAAAGAVATEALVIMAVLVPHPLVVAAAGLGALMLHVGFWQLQGVWWPAWWALLPAFVPWHAVVSAMRRRRVDPAVTPADLAMMDRRNARLPRAAAIAMCALVIQQPLVSFARLDYPMLSSYPMYADVQWSSKEEFAAWMERERRPSTPAIRLDPDASVARTSFAAALAELDRDRVLDQAAVILVEGERSLTDGERRAIAVVAMQWHDRFGSTFPQVRVQTGGWRFDWSVAGFVPEGPWRLAAVLEP